MAIGLISIINGAIQSAPLIIADEAKIEAAVAKFNAVPAPKPPSAIIILVADILYAVPDLADKIATMIPAAAPAPPTPAK